jgi:hypothetical protein
MRSKMILAAAVLLIWSAAPALAQGGKMTMEQTLSDEAQRTTIAFDGLAFVTGSLGADSFFPPGKVADFWGFQYLRDNDPTEMGHNTDFLTRAANNVLYVLNAYQRAELESLAKSQVDDINQYAYDRFVLMKAFRHLLEGDVPAGRPVLDREAVKAYSVELYRLDGQMSFERAQVMGRIIHSLDAGQRAHLDAMVGKGMLNWPNLRDQLDPRQYTHDVHVAIMTYAGDIFSWYAGSIDADVYFCPERQGTYFGSFYLKDAPAVGNPNYSISTNITGDMGNAFLAALTPAQSGLVTGLVDLQRSWLEEIVTVRRQISTELRRAIAGLDVDSKMVLSLADRYGELDGEIVCSYAERFAKVGKALTAAQKADFTALRKTLIGDLAPTGAYVYAEPVAMPTIVDTDFLFGGAAKGGSGRR